MEIYVADTKEPKKPFISSSPYSKVKTTCFIDCFRESDNLSDANKGREIDS